MASNNVAPMDRSSATKLLAVSFAFPPLAYPRSIQVARLLKYVSLRTVLVCADERAARKDPTLEPDAASQLEALLRVPFSVSRALAYANAAAHRFRPALWNHWNRRPDNYATWKSAALRAVETYARANLYAPDAIVTFSQPTTDHLIGLELKKRFRVPWIAHFSDPWVENPFYSTDAPTRDFNLAAERAVCESAERLVFTSAETVELVMSKHPAAWREKARVLPQCFDPRLYPSHASQDAERTRSDDDARISDDGARIVVRHVGNFYGARTPAPLLRALAALAETDESLLRGVAFELIGVSDPSLVVGEVAESLPAGLVKTTPPVGYRESLRLMSEADGLLIVDAPADISVFLPSKLIDYLGAARPVFGFTPRGAARTLIERLGGWTVDPSDTRAGADALKNFLDLLRARRGDTRAWGEAAVRREYEATHLAAKFEEIVRELLT
jgi:glycosyltransferase involved in cell wall biosynthesis